MCLILHSFIAISIKNLITEIIVTCFETAAFITYYLCIGIWEINALGNEMTHPESLKMYVQLRIKIQAVDLHCVCSTIFFSVSLFFFFSFKPHQFYIKLENSTVLLSLSNCNWHLASFFS